MKIKVTDIIKNTKSVSELRELCQSDRKKHIGIYNAEDNVKALYAAVLGDEKGSSLLICSSEGKAKQYVDYLNGIHPGKALYFPAEPFHYLFLDIRSREISHERIRVLNSILTQKGKLVVTTVESLMKKMISRESFKKLSITIKAEDLLDIDELSEKLVLLGYERTEQVENRGEFSVRGGIVDVFDVSSEQPFRIELFDNEIDSIRIFDPIDQKSIEKVKKAHISPNEEMIFEKDEMRSIMASFKEDMEKYLKKISGHKEAAANLWERFDNIVEERDINYHQLIPWYKGESVDLLSWFQDDSRIFLDEANSFAELLSAVRSQIEEEYKNLLEKGGILPKLLERIYQPGDIRNRIEKFKTIEFERLHKRFAFIPADIEIDAGSKDIYAFYGRVGALADQIIEWFAKEYSIYIACSDKNQVSSVVEMLNSYNIAFSFSESGAKPDHGSVNILESALSSGFEIDKDKIVLITYNEIFHKETRKKKERKKAGKKIEAFTQLNVGDYIVHDVHGIGVYLGIEQITIEGIKKDFLNLKYGKGDKLYIPVDQMDSIQVYMGYGDKEPKLSRLDSQEWKKAKISAKKSVQEMAQELLDIYAKRISAKGFKFSRDNEWVREFEDKFPYDETEDQLKAIKDLKRDMEQDVPMDRLICGDVGYGKTEVAIRGAFKAVMDSKQVALLVPTTILAQQHYNNFVQRFSDYPIKIEMLSRFRTKKQQDAIIKDIGKKRVDIVIGTHRLLSKDLKFDDLGLLIIDEEQRFGVRHKEKIKALKSNIDVLTLTATPIPRTLHMSLIGARDMSVIDEPPHNRTPVQTYVMEYNDLIIRDAIQREISREGQVYYVFNRVTGIDEVAAKIGKMVPTAKIAVAHGQMGETELENVMLDFMDHKYDVLVATSIIESGLDISKANTIVIENADQMGLSQLYQLRGRVGRSDRLSFAYITYKKDKNLTEVAEKRLKAIKDFTDFGSGFKIAMRDLEIRGAGNILGSQQHGHLMSVGYDMFTRLLEEAVKGLMGEEVKEKVSTSIEIKADAYVPPAYISSEKQKYDLYRKISGIDSETEIHEIQEELIDRYGDVPYSLINLMNIAFIKNTASEIGIFSIKEMKDALKIIFDKNNYLSVHEIKELIKTNGIKFNPGDENMSLSIKNLGDGKKNIAALKSLMVKIKSLKKNDHPI
ncbi:MAG: transcription-repair coupling factor [Eubacteriaceae bacterium]|nr:transcription-repair coupling factor [Eubacteriaceae bacterium]